MVFSTQQGDSVAEQLRSLSTAWRRVANCNSHAPYALRYRAAVQRYGHRRLAIFQIEQKGESDGPLRGTTLPQVFLENYRRSSDTVLACHIEHRAHRCDDGVFGSFRIRSHCNYRWFCRTFVSHRIASAVCICIRNFGKNHR